MEIIFFPEINGSNLKEKKKNVSKMLNFFKKVCLCVKKFELDRFGKN
jgi:hypothetical protein